jgi:hypothetical protein
VLRTCSCVIALNAIVTALSMTVQAADETLMLACKGTVQRNAMKSEPVSVGIIVNFTARTITGFTLEKLPLTMLNSNDTTVQFSGSDLTSSLIIDGIIDRVTGDLEATSIRQPSITETAAATTIESGVGGEAGGRGGLVKGARPMSVAPPGGQDRIMIYWPQDQRHLYHRVSHGRRRVVGD